MPFFLFLFAASEIYRQFVYHYQWSGHPNISGLQQYAHSKMTENIFGYMSRYFLGFFEEKRIVFSSCRPDGFTVSSPRRRKGAREC